MARRTTAAPAAPVTPAAPVVEVKPSDPPVGIAFDNLPKSEEAPYVAPGRKPGSDPLTDTPPFVRERMDDAYGRGRHTPDGSFVPQWRIQAFHNALQAGEFVRLAKRYARAKDLTPSAYQVEKVGETYKPSETGAIVRYTMRPKITRTRS